MKLHEMNRQYPMAARGIRRLIDMSLIAEDAHEGLSHYALERIEDGRTSETDLRLLLQARGGKRR